MSLWKASATLDSTEKQCCVRRTDGEELKNRSQALPSWDTSVALFFCAIKGKPASRWLVTIPPAQNLRTDSGSDRLVLQFKDGLLSEQDQELPFARHVLGFFQHIDLVKDFISGKSVRP